jgi:uncharacterized protein YecE (DUF72 family)
MLEKSASRIEFVVKAFQGLTHERTGKLAFQILPRFKASIDPFWREGRLGTVLHQFLLGWGLLFFFNS